MRLGRTLETHVASRLELSLSYLEHTESVAASEITSRQGF